MAGFVAIHGCLGRIEKLCFPRNRVLTSSSHREASHNVFVRISFLSAVSSTYTDSLLSGVDQVIQLLNESTWCLS